ncbi:MBL fold metallo-hydrolase, partial [Candidatus Roizmanbacteria bacterium]|nr:MBL fold metallo-hydrolase [Candidatus Roizmanbacteria bacterium]
MEVLRFSLGQLQTNCYFVVQNGGCLLIDPADEASFILEEIQRRKLKLVRI